MVCGAKFDDSRLTSKSAAVSAGLWCRMSKSCKCQKVQAQVVFSLFYSID